MRLPSLSPTETHMTVQVQWSQAMEHHLRGTVTRPSTSPQKPKVPAKLHTPWGGDLEVLGLKQFVLNITFFLLSVESGPSAQAEARAKWGPKLIWMRRGAIRQNRKTSAIVYSLRRHPAGARTWQRWHKVRPHADASSQVSRRIGSLKRPAPERACLWLHSGASFIMRRWMFERTVVT